MAYINSIKFNNKIDSKEYICENDIVIIKGNASYDDGVPIENAVVLVEKYKRYNKCYEIIGYTITDNNGNFVIAILDRNSKYKITINESNLSKKVLYY